MKLRFTLFVLGGILVSEALSQTAEETMEFVKNSVQTYSYRPGYENGCIFGRTGLPSDMAQYFGASYAQNDYLFSIYRDYRPPGVAYEALRQYLLDIRGISMIMVTSETGLGSSPKTYKIMKIHVRSGFVCKERFSTSDGTLEDWHDVSFAEIPLNATDGAIQQIRRALLKLSAQWGGTPIDEGKF